MAVMTSQTPIGAQEQKQPSAIAPVPAVAGAGAMATDEAVVGMDLDTLGSKNESPSAPATSPPNEASSTDGDADSTVVNGTKEITAPPSPPVPTPPLHITNDNNSKDLSDLHITSPNGSFMPNGENPLNAAHDDDFTDTRMEDAPMGERSEAKKEPVMEEEPHTNGKSQPSGDNEATNPSTDQSQAAPTDSQSENKESKSTVPAVKREDTEDKPMEDAAPLKKTSRDRDEEDEDGDRPSKRAKTEDGGDSQPSGAADTTGPELTGPMTPARHKHVLGVVRSLRRSKDGRPFTMPVDAVKLNVPHYYDVVKNPMDLQTMERKLNNNDYTDIDTFVADFKLILHNCELFNGKDHIVTNMSKVMEAAFYRHMNDLPSEDVEDLVKPNPKSKKKGASRESTSGATKKSAAKTTVKPKEPKSTAQSPAATSPVFSLHPSGMPQIRRDSTLGDGRPKREIHPPAPKDLPYSTKPRRKQNAAELKFCDIVLKELYKKVHADYAFPFYQPVDPVALNIPDYFKIVKKPMDLSTIQEKLKVNAYEDASEFEADVRLMFNNCYKFNPEGQAVHMMGRRLEAVFDEKWKDKPAYTRNMQGSRSPTSASPPPHDELEMSEEEDDDDENPADKKTIQELEKKLESVKDMLAAMKSKKKSPPASKKKGSAHVRKASNAAPPSSSRKSSGKKGAPHITLEQKTELSERINFLAPQYMKRALKMIRENMPDVGNDGAEIELDIDELDPVTLHRLYQYVVRHAPPAPETYKPPPPPPAPSHKEHERKSSQAGQKIKKNKPMSAAEQEARIQELQGRVSMFDNPGATVPQTPDPNVDSESSDDDDDESSGSESEEE